MANRTRLSVPDRQRDVFDWLGVVVNVVQGALYMVAIVGMLYWYVDRGGGLPAVLVGLTVTTLVLLGCAVYGLTLVRRRR
jgi:hypothetical protein